MSEVMRKDSKTMQERQAELELALREVIKIWVTLRLTLGESEDDIVKHGKEALYSLYTKPFGDGE